MSDVYAIPFRALDLGKPDRVGGKNASLGEMIQHLTPLGVRVPDGFAVTAAAFRRQLAQDGLEDEVYAALDGLDVEDVTALARIGHRIRQRIRATPLPEDVVREMLNHRGTVVKVKCGPAIDADTLGLLGGRAAIAPYLRASTYLIRARSQYRRPLRLGRPGPATACPRVRACSYGQAGCAAGGPSAPTFTLLHVSKPELRQHLRSMPPVACMPPRTSPCAEALFHGMAPKKKKRSLSASAAPGPAATTAPAPASPGAEEVSGAGMLQPERAVALK